MQITYNQITPHLKSLQITKHYIHMQQQMDMYLYLYVTYNKLQRYV